MKDIAFRGTSTAQPARGLRLSRNTLIVLTVVALHVFLIWGLQSGLLVRTAERIVQVEILSEFIDPPRALPAPPVPPRQATAETAVPIKQAARPAVPAQPRPLAVAEPEPDAVFSAPPPAAALPPAASGSQITATAAPASTLATAATAAVQLPSSDADYLQNPKPAYPPLSRRLSEQGKVTVRVLIGADGQPQKAELRLSSGFERLDQAALATVMKWRYVPGKRGGVAETMWFNVPLNFVLE